MSCGKRPLVKLWDKPKRLRTVKSSRYEQNEACVKVHWKNVIKELEAYYGEDKFWETQTGTVRELVGPVIYERLAKIFNLPLHEKEYVPSPEPSIVIPSEQFYISHPKSDDKHSVTEIESMSEEEEEEQEKEEWTGSISTESTSGGAGVHHAKSNKSSRSITYVPSLRGSFKSFSKIMSVYSKTFGNRIYMPSFTNRSEMKESVTSTPTAYTNDDVIVHPKSISHKFRRQGRRKPVHNPHFEMLYCNESVTDMIKWNSKIYKRRTFDLSASDEYSKKAELMTKEIAYGFYEWWVNVGSADYKSEIKRPQDIEDLFQVWFDEHASRGLMLDPKILPCVLQRIANYVGVPKASCPKALKRQLAWDIHAETSPAHTTAFNSALPLKMKHIPPKNNTAELWRAVAIPKDLKTMSAVWGDISHLTSTKAFKTWLQQRPYMPMPEFLKSLGATDDKKQLFVIPSDYVMRERVDAVSSHELNIPVSQFTLEIKEVLSKLFND